MSRAAPFFDDKGEFHGVRIECPGCEFGGHLLPVRWLPVGAVESPHLAGKDRWDFNGDMERPTFYPSIKTSAEFGPERRPFVCHSYVTDGQIKYLTDCTHALSGQTVDLPEVE